ncbi:MAG: glycosyltransferase [Pseudomonadota bacterium]
MSQKLKIYIGYDTREDIAYQVAKYSILRHTGGDVEIYPLKQAELRELGLYTRPTDKASTEFSITRFLTPYLAAFDGWSIFVDCDFLITRDITEIFDVLDNDKALYCVQHDYTPANMIKMDGKQQTVYPRKNWSSFMAFNGAHPNVKALTPSVVNGETPAFLHRFSWLSDDMLGELDREWNFLEGEYAKPETPPMCIHYTNGGPWFDNWQDVDYAAEWIAERDLYLATSATAAAE